MQQDYVLRKIEMLGKVLALALSKLFKLPSNSFQEEVQELVSTNDDLRELMESDIIFFEKKIKSMNMPDRINSDLIQFFHKLYTLTDDSTLKELYRSKCILLDKNSDAISLENYNIINNLKTEHSGQQENENNSHQL